MFTHPLNYSRQHLNMTLVSNDPGFWPQINFNRVSSYFIVASSIAILYDWALNFGQEVELLWRQRWSFVTFLYISLRYIGLSFAVDNAIASLTTVSMTDAGCRNTYIAQWWLLFVADIILGAIVIIRLHAMYQRSRKMLIFLVGTFLAVTTTCSVMSGIGSRPFTGEEIVLSGTYACNITEDQPQLIRWARVVGTAWETLALCLAVWIAIKHFREQKRLVASTRSTIGDCFAMLIKSQVLYFIGFVAVSCFDFGYFSQQLWASESTGAQIYDGVILFIFPVQIFVLGPHLILSIREYHAELVENSEAGTVFTTMCFQERIPVSTISDSGV